MQAVKAALKDLGFSSIELRVVLEVGGNEALKSAVINKLGLGFISKWAVQEELKVGSLEIIDIPGVKITRQFYAVCRPPLVPTCFQLFWNFLTGCAAAAK